MYRRNSPDIYFRDIHPGFGRDRVSNRTDDGRVVINSMMPSQLTFIFDVDNPEHVPRTLLGRESLHLCGFPWDVINSVQREEQTFTESAMQGLAGNMLAVPVFRASFVSALAAAGMGTASDQEDSQPLPLDKDLDELDDLLSISKEDHEKEEPKEAEVGADATTVRERIQGLLQTRFRPVTARP